MDVAATPIVAQKGAFMACENGVEMAVFFRRNLPDFGGEGFIMQKFSGQGMVFLRLMAQQLKNTLRRCEMLTVDTGYVAAMEATCSIDVTTVSGIGNAVFGGRDCLIHR